jgi:ADP-ribosylglycohydrolase
MLQRQCRTGVIEFLEAEDFEDAIRNAVSLGGDTDTLGAITGSIAEAYFGIPAVLIGECR